MTRADKHGFEDCKMIIDPNKVSRVLNSGTAIDSWSLMKIQRWAHTSSCRAVTLPITLSTWGATPSLTTGQRSASVAEARWKKHLLRASPWSRQPAFKAIRRLVSTAAT